MELSDSEPYEPSLHVTVTIATSSAPWGEPMTAWITQFDSPPDDRAALAEATRSLVSGEGHVSHTFRYEGGQTSWGGFGEEFYNLYLLVAEHAIDLGFGALVGVLFKSLKDRFGRANQEAEQRPLTRPEAVMRARMLVVSSFEPAASVRKSVDPESLQLVSDEHDLESGQWTIVFRAPEGSTYEVTLGLSEGLPTTARIRRSYRAEQ